MAWLSEFKLDLVGLPAILGEIAVPELSQEYEKIFAL